MPQVDIGTETYGAYASLDDADVYLGADVLRATGWALRNEDQKGRGLVSSTRMMQTLPWLDGAPAVDDPDLPVVVAEVCAMLAADLLAKPKLFAEAASGSNIKLVKAGSAQVEFFSPVAGGPPIPRSLWDLLVNANLVGLDDGPTLNDAPFVSGAQGCRPLSGRHPWDWPIAEQDYD